MMTACLLVWCLGGPIGSPHGVTVTSDIRNDGRTERTVAYEFPWLVVGAVEQTQERDAVFAGALPLKIDMFRGHLRFAGGAIAASASVPDRGTHLNFMARLQVRIIHRVSLAYWHWSNGNLGERNPSVDSIGVTVELRR